jgi:hypothetical protein
MHGLVHHALFIRRAVRKLTMITALIVMAACSGSPLSPSGGLSDQIGALPVLVGAGDIGMCGSPGPAATAQLVERIGGTVIAVGDLAYPSGRASDFRDCYEPAWGSLRSRTKPVPGNHDYETPNADPYFAYFGAVSAPPLGYYSYAVGSWQVLALNSETDVRPGSPQMNWLRLELSRNSSRCTLAYFHRPLFSSGPNGQQNDTRDIWRTLYEFDVDVVVNGHEHFYERFAPQDPNGRADPARGLRQFTVGTGGTSLTQPRAASPNSEFRESTFGVIRLVLGEGFYEWEFLAVSGGFRDAGVGMCH